MQFFRRNWAVVVFLGAILLSYGVSDHQSSARDASQRAQLVAGCERSSARFAMSAAGQHILSERVRERGAPGDAESADSYAAVGLSEAELIPAPKRFMGSVEELVRVYPVLDKDGRVTRFKLTPGAEALQKAGCEEAFS